MCMTLSETKRGARVAVARVMAERSLADRLCVLGIRTGAMLFVLKVSARKKVWYVRTPAAMVALGAALARAIEVTA